MASKWKHFFINGKVIYTIYKATSPSGKIYIGYTSRKLKYRIKEHLYDAKRGSKLPFHYALRKYGNAVKFEIINVYFNKKLAIYMELYFIKKYRSCLSKKGYNAKGDNYELNYSNLNLTEKGRKALSDNAKKMWKEDRESLVEKLKIANKNNTFTETAIDLSKVSNCKAVIDSRGCIYFSLAEAGRYSKTTESNIRASIKNGYTVKGIKYALYNNGNFCFKLIYKNHIKCNQSNIIYKSAKEAANIIGLPNPMSINRVCRNERSSYYGYSFKYVIGVL